MTAKDQSKGTVTSMIFAKAGDPVTDTFGNVICYVKNDLQRHGTISASDFHDFTEGNIPWVGGETVDRRCVRDNVTGRQICINGEWRP